MYPTDNTFDSNRFFFRHWAIDDAEALFKYASDCRVSEPAQWPCHTSVYMSREVIEKYFLPNPECYAIIDKQTLEPIGCVGLVPEGGEYYTPLTGEREVGYWVGYPHWGNGIAPETLQRFMIFCRDQLGLQSLLLTTLADNIGSRRVAEKCGFRQIDKFEYDGKASIAHRTILK